MKDLYKRLGFGGEEDNKEAIRVAIESGTYNRSDCIAAEAILLTNRRKTIYDRHRRVLCQIGELRANLGLSHSENWSRGGYRDFDTSPTLVPQLD